MSFIAPFLIQNNGTKCGGCPVVEYRLDGCYCGHFNERIFENQIGEFERCKGCQTAESQFKVCGKCRFQKKSMGLIYAIYSCEYYSEALSKSGIGIEKCENCLNGDI